MTRFTIARSPNAIMTPTLPNEFQKPFNATDGDARSLTPNANNGVAQETPSFPRHIPGNLLHPLLIRMHRDPSHFQLAACQVDEEQHIERQQPSMRENLNAEEVRPHQHRQVGFYELRPRRRLLPLLNHRTCAPRAVETIPESYRAEPHWPRPPAPCGPVDDRSRPALRAAHPTTASALRAAISNSGSRQPGTHCAAAVPGPLFP